MRPLLSFDTAVLVACALNGILLLTGSCLLALFAARRLFRHDPSLRYFVCLLGLIGLLLTPVVVCLQNQTGFGLLALSLPIAMESTTEEVDRETGLSITRAYTGRDAGDHAQAWIAPGFLALISVWGIGIALGLVRLGCGWLLVRRLTADRHLWSAAGQIEPPDILEPVRGRIRPPIFISPHTPSPVAIGLYRPCVVLPEGLTETLAPAQLRQVLRHEFAHIAFRHLIGGLVERMTGLLFWPHPLVHALCRELARAREEVCDNVASQENGAACYARTLLAMAQGSMTAPNATSALALLGPEPPLEERIAGLLHPRRNRMVRIRRGKLWAVTGVAVVAMGSCAMVRVVAAQETSKADKAKQEAVRTYRVREAAAKRTAEAKSRQAPAPTKSLDSRYVNYDGKSYWDDTEQLLDKIPDGASSATGETEQLLDKVPDGARSATGEAEYVAKRRAESKAQGANGKAHFDLHDARSSSEAYKTKEYAAKRKAEIEALGPVMADAHAAKRKAEIEALGPVMQERLSTAR